MVTMKRAFLAFGAVFLLVFFIGVAVQPVPAFAQDTGASEEVEIQELRAIITQLLSLIVGLQQQLLAVLQSQTPAGVGCGQTEVVWEKVSGAEEYVLYRNGAAVYSGADLKFTDTGLTPGAQYAYTVRAKNAGGLGAASPVQTIAIPSQCPPLTPFIWAQTAVCGGNIQVWWSRVQGATFYEVFRGNTRVFGGLSVSFVDRSLSTGEDYIYKARAGNAGGLGEFSQEIRVKSSAACPPDAPKAPEAPKVGSPSFDDGRAEEGALTLAMHGSPSGATARSGGGSVNILSFQARAKHSSVVIKQVDVDFSDRPWLFLSVVELRDGGNTVARIEASQDAFVAVGDDSYRLRFSGLGIRIGADGSKNITVGVVAKNNLFSLERRELIVSIPVNSVRGTDEIGVPHAGPDSAAAGNFLKTFFVEKELP